jgi:hypothetical protein
MKTFLSIFAVAAALVAVAFAWRENRQARQAEASLKLVQQTEAAARDLRK